MRSLTLALITVFALAPAARAFDGGHAGPPPTRAEKQAAQKAGRAEAAKQQTRMIYSSRRELR